MPSNFLFDKKKFGEIKAEINEISENCWLKDSLILNEDEMLSLIQMTGSTNGKLLYRATRDGFSAQEFHSKCDYQANTITIIRNDLNYVFGGYASAAWKSGCKFAVDHNVYSLRRNGESKKEKFMVNRSYTTSFIMWSNIWSK